MSSSEEAVEEDLQKGDRISSSGSSAVPEAAAVGRGATEGGEAHVPVRGGSAGDPSHRAGNIRSLCFRIVTLS